VCVAGVDGGQVSLDRLASGLFRRSPVGAERRHRMRSAMSVRVWRGSMSKKLRLVSKCLGSSASGRWATPNFGAHLRMGLSISARYAGCGSAMLDLRSPVATPVACWQQGSTLEKSVVGIATVKLKQLQLFARLVEAGSFTRAAHALSVTRSSASRELKQLEAE